MANGTDWTRKKLLILPFDHRGTFLKKLFKVSDRKDFTDEETVMVTACKNIVYQGFLKALASGAVTKDEAGILVDEQFGSGIITDAIKKGIPVALTCEKSGQNEFDFQYGDAYEQHIEQFRPTLAKVLVRYNIEGDAENKAMNDRQAARLKRMNDHLSTTSYAYLFELLVPPTKEQLASVGGSQERFDKELRPGLMVAAIKELHKRGIDPDVWKLEGVDTEKDAHAIVAAVQEGGRKAGVIILGRGADSAAVEHWLRVGAKVQGAIGFAVGRTIFWDAIAKYYNKEATAEEAAQEVADTYTHFVKVWKGA